MNSLIYSGKFQDSKWSFQIGVKFEDVVLTWYPNGVQNEVLIGVSNIFLYTCFELAKFTSEKVCKLNS